MSWLGMSLDEERQARGLLAVGLPTGAALIPAHLLGFMEGTSTGVETGVGYGLWLVGVLCSLVVVWRRPVLGLVGIPTAVLVLSCLCYLVFLSIRSAKVTDLRSHLSEYLALDGQLLENGAGPLSLRRKLVVVDPNRKVFDELHFHLRSELRASKAAEVGSVIQITHKLVFLGRNNTGHNDYRHDWYVRIFDNANPPRLIFDREFCGDLPPSPAPPESRDNYSDLPKAAVLLFLESACGL